MTNPADNPFLPIFAALAASGLGASVTFSVYPSREDEPAEVDEPDGEEQRNYAAAEPMRGDPIQPRAADWVSPRPFAKFALGDKPWIAGSDGRFVQGQITAVTHYLDGMPTYSLEFPRETLEPGESRHKWREECELFESEPEPPAR